MAYVLDNDKDNIWGCYKYKYKPTPNVLTPDHYKQKTKREVVSVHVGFIGSDSWKKSRSDYAVKIQKYFRGFRVRKSINKLLELNRAAVDVQRLVAAFHDDDNDNDNDKERLNKVNEALMALLFKLDAVNPIDDAVRVCRNNVILKACLLLQRIDSIAKPAHSRVLVLETPHVDGKPAHDECSDDEDDDYTEDHCSDDSSEGDYDDDDDDDDEESFGKSSEVADNAAVGETSQDKGEIILSDEVSSLEKPSQVKKAASVDMEKVEEDDDGEAWECVGEEDDNMEFLDMKQRQGGWLVVKENNLMVKLMEENHKLMKTVAELCNKTEDQAVLITNLFDRVKQLEVSVQELEDVHLFDSLSINKADKGCRSFLPTAR